MSSCGVLVCAQSNWQDRSKVVLGCRLKREITKEPKHWTSVYMQQHTGTLTRNKQKGGLACLYPIARWTSSHPTNADCGVCPMCRAAGSALPYLTACCIASLTPVSRALPSRLKQKPLSSLTTDLTRRLDSPQPANQPRPLRTTKPSRNGYCATPTAVHARRRIKRAPTKRAVEP
ncbi:hypothetical protein BKA80DRAFT_143867 [Phyllosticta citrichinensis]